MKKKKGTTLIELLVVMVLIGIMVVAFGQIYASGMKTYREQLAQTRLSSEAQTILDRITTETKMAKQVEAEYNTFTTGGNTLILNLPAVDNDQNFLYTGSNLRVDRVIYYQVGSELHRLVYADSGSIRYSQNNQDTVLTKKLSTMTFTYDPEINLPGLVQTQLAFAEKVGNDQRVVEVKGKAKLRNNL